MIVTCPNCATRYRVDDAAFKSGGRAVRCAHCTAEWYQIGPTSAPDGMGDQSAIELKIGDDDAPRRPVAALPPPGGGFGAGMPATTDAFRDLGDDPDRNPRGASDAEILPTALDAAATTSAISERVSSGGRVNVSPLDAASAPPPASAPPKRHSLRLALFVAAAAAAASPVIYHFATRDAARTDSVATAAPAFVEPVAVTSPEPAVADPAPTRRTFSAPAGAAALRTGVVFVEFKYDLVERAEGPALEVWGRVANNGPSAAPSPTIEIVSLNEQGDMLQRWLARPETAEIAPGESARFSSRMMYPEGPVYDVELSFPAQ